MKKTTECNIPAESSEVTAFFSAEKVSNKDLFAVVCQIASNLGLLARVGTLFSTMILPTCREDEDCMILFPRVHSSVKNHSHRATHLERLKV
jgi:hypothetical protein